MAKILRPLKAIRAKCLDCSGESAFEVRRCPIQSCPLWPYRFGKRPTTAGLGVDSELTNTRLRNDSAPDAISSGT